MSLHLFGTHEEITLFYLVSFYATTVSSTSARPPQTLTVPSCSRRRNLTKLKSSLSLLAPAGLWKLKSWREWVKIEGERYKRVRGLGFFCSQTGFALPLHQVLRCFLFLVCFLFPPLSLCWVERTSTVDDVTCYHWQSLPLFRAAHEMNPQTTSCFLWPLCSILYNWSCFMATIRRVIENPWLIDSDSQ